MRLRLGSASDHQPGHRQENLRKPIRKVDTYMGRDSFVSSLLPRTFPYSFLFIALFVMALPSSVFAQKHPDTGKIGVDTLAIVGGQPITTEDFRNRYELSLYAGKDYRDTTKMEFLYSMIAEKLLSQAGASSDEPLTPVESDVVKEMDEIFLRDALYRTQVLPAVEVSREELARGLRFSTYSYILDAFYFPDSLSARKFYDLSSREKKNIYELADSLSVSHDTLQIGYGESTEGIENAFFGNRKGFLSGPTITVDGWVLFKIISREVNKKFSGVATEDKAAMVRKIIESREQTELGGKYLSGVMKNVKVDVNYDVFRPLVYSIQKLISVKHPESFDPYYYLSAQDVLTLRDEFAAELSTPILSFNGGNLTLDRVFKELPVSGFHAVDTTVPQITVALHSALRFISQNYFLAEKARELGLDNSGEVKYNVQMFLDAYRSSRISDEVTDTVQVSQREVDEFFKNHQDEVLNGIQLKLKKFEAGNINDVVRMYDKLMDDQMRSPDDTSGEWTRASQLGEIGAVLAQQKNGTVYGPIFDDGKFCIYRIIDKRSALSEATIGHSIDVAREMAIEMKREKALSQYIAGLAAKAGVRFNYQNIRAMKVSDIQMLTFRYIGFGGRILAVPMLYPRQSWIKYYRNERPPAP